MVGNRIAQVPGTSARFENIIVARYFTIVARYFNPWLWRPQRVCPARPSRRLAEVAGLERKFRSELCSDLHIGRVEKTNGRAK